MVKRVKETETERTTASLDEWLDDSVTTVVWRESATGRPVRDAFALGVVKLTSSRARRRGRGRGRRRKRFDHRVWFVVISFEFARSTHSLI